jgi:hypothetical protein
MSFYRIIVKDNLNLQKNGPLQTPTKFQIMLWGIFTLLGLSVLTALLFASFVIGLLLAIPLVFLGLLWILSLVLRGKFHLHRGSFRI